MSVLCWQWYTAANNTGWCLLFPAGTTNDDELRHGEIPTIQMPIANNPLNNLKPYDLRSTSLTSFDQTPESERILGNKIRSLSDNAGADVRTHFNETHPGVRALTCEGMGNGLLQQSSDSLDRYSVMTGSQSIRTTLSSETLMTNARSQYDSDPSIARTPNIHVPIGQWP